VAAGVRRIEALSSDAAIEDFKTKESWIKSMSETLKVVPSQVPERVAKLLDSNRDLERQIQELKRKLASGTSSGDVLEATYRGQQLKVHSFVDVDSDFLKQKGDQLRQTEPESIHVLLCGTAVLVVLEPKKNPKAHAGQILKELTQVLGGRGGGQAHMAQGQTTADPALAKKVVEWAKSSS
jgi:alanyl-tRNA synthetase